MNYSILGRSTIANAGARLQGGPGVWMGTSKGVRMFSYLYTMLIFFDISRYLKIYDDRSRSVTKAFAKGLLSEASGKS